MSRIKVSDLKVTERELPLLVYVNQPKPAWGEEEKLPLLHICTRDGVNAKQRRMAYHSPDTYHITNCNRPIEWSNLYHGKELDTSNYRLCPRCAPKGKTLETFEAMLAEYRKRRAESDARYAQEKKREKAQRQQERLELSDRLHEVILAKTNGAIETVGEPVYSLRFEHKGYTYEIREVSGE